MDSIDYIEHILSIELQNLYGAIVKWINLVGALLLLLVGVSISLFYKPDHLVTNQELEIYGESYLQALRREVSPFKLNDQEYFPKFRILNKTIGVKTMISNLHGAAIEFITNASASHFKSTRTDKRIEVAVFGGNFDDPTGMRLVFGEYTNFYMGEGVGFIMGGQNLIFEVLDTGTFSIYGNGWHIDDVYYYNPITVKGSNMASSWTEDKAVRDAKIDFKWNLGEALNSSEGVREYVAESELAGNLSNIAKRLKTDPKYGLTQLEIDLEKVNRTAYEKYGITRPDFIKEVFDVIKMKTSLSKKLPVFSISYNNNFEYTLFFALLLDLSYILAVSLDRILKYIKKKWSKTIEILAKQVMQWFTLFFVLVLFVENVPFDYQWVVHVPILLIQFVALIFISTKVTKLRSWFHLNWRSVVYRSLFGLFALMIVLVTIHLFLNIIDAPILFHVVSITIGKVTILSVLTASIAILAILASQLIHDRVMKV